jgi:hypothetical protein
VEVPPRVVNKERQMASLGSAQELAERLAGVATALGAASRGFEFPNLAKALGAASKGFELPNLAKAVVLTGSDDGADRGEA